MRTIDLGCGTAKVPGTIGVEVVPLPGVNVIANLTQYPYPFADDIFDKLYLNDVIEHLPDTIKSMEELYRICRPNAHVYIRVINWNSSYNADDPQHVRTFSENTFKFFGTYKDRAYYSTARFSIDGLKKEYSLHARRWFRSKTLMEFLSRYLNNVLETLHFDLRAEKPLAEATNITESETSFTEYLRCPHCVGDKATARLSVLRENHGWLLCSNHDCNRKYPIYKGIAVMTLSEGSKWKDTELKKLPKDIPLEYREIKLESV